jgi:hypothetical protein
MVSRKCTDCPRKFASYKSFQKHWWDKHYKSKAKKQKVKTGPWTRPKRPKK